MHPAAEPPRRTCEQSKQPDTFRVLATISVQLPHLCDSVCLDALDGLAATTTPVTLVCCVCSCTPPPCHAQTNALPPSAVVARPNLNLTCVSTLIPRSPLFVHLRFSSGGRGCRARPPVRGEADRGVQLRGPRVHGDGGRRWLGPARGAPAAGEDGGGPGERPVPAGMFGTVFRLLPGLRCGSILSLLSLAWKTRGRGGGGSARCVCRVFLYVVRRALLFIPFCHGHCLFFGEACGTFALLMCCFVPLLCACYTCVCPHVRMHISIYLYTSLVCVATSGNAHTRHLYSQT